MKSGLVLASLVFALSNAQTNPPLTDLTEILDAPPEIQSLINSVESRASSAALSSGAMPNMRSRLALTNGVVGAVAGWYLVN
ncbi:hypothetical protein CC80DRAFT_552848 [Byssothecium circinans]|uniref:Uncharacterized protein n=1 Tax=Byssothecium circinans TaxID=147558 RepID=A0A6A5TMR3_9PLEO|nr:hypothetical protein CC80DRAFT_552848 [Byssothecium circinans]